MLEEWLSQLGLGGVAVVLFGTITLVQISPLKIDPWSHLFKWIGETVNGDLKTEIKAINERLDGIEERMSNSEKEDLDDKLEAMRWNILDFSSAVRAGRRYDKEAWDHVIDQLGKYERIIEENHIPNGVFKSNAKFLRYEYEQHLHKADFL